MTDTVAHLSTARSYVAPVLTNIMTNSDVQHPPLHPHGVVVDTANRYLPDYGSIRTEEHKI